MNFKEIFIDQFIQEAKLLEEIHETEMTKADKERLMYLTKLIELEYLQGIEQ
jgi:hypothetical protein